MNTTSQTKKKKKKKTRSGSSYSLLFLILFCAVFQRREIHAQQAISFKYAIYFKDKNIGSLENPMTFLSKKTLHKRKKLGIKLSIEDVPVNSSYVNQVLSLRSDFVLHGVSKWKNCAVIESADSILPSLFDGLVYIDHSELIFKGKRAKSTQSAKVNFSSTPQAKDKLKVKKLKNSPYGKTELQVKMLNIPFLHKKKLWGQNIHVAIFDGGFQHVDTIEAFKHLFADDRIIHVYDYASRESDVYEDGDHGTRVLACMAGFIPGQYIGNAPLAKYSLFRTEDAYTETIVEEFNWLFAAEFCDSVGVDIINSSLGYTKFDKDQPTDFSYNYSKLNGKVGIASFAATMLSKKGILVCNSAGNSGNESWKFIGIPADAEGIFSVGAVDKSQNKASFSSLGPTVDNRVKPNICAMGVNAAVISGYGRITSSNGTSFSSPIFCSALTCLLQKFPHKSPETFIEIIQSTSSNALAPNAALGYGIPNFEKAYEALKKSKK